MTAPAIERPYTLISCCISLDGYLDGASGPRWVLSNDADLDRVDQLRSSCDAILVGAGTIRRDNPRLLVRDQRRRQERALRGLELSPIKVTLTTGANLSRDAAFFTAGTEPKIIYCPESQVDAIRGRLGHLAVVVGLVDHVDHVDIQRMGEDLHCRRVRRLMVEGGSSVLTQFLAADLVDELQLAIAPVFVGDSRAPRFVRDGTFPWRPGRRAQLIDAYAIGDVVVHRYALSPRFSP